MSLLTFAVFKHIDNDLQEMSPEQLKKLQKTLLEMMADIDAICRKNNITYHLGGGSCLGAVRHNGFIPWDDDMDINMPRKDYEKFYKIFKKEMSDKYHISHQKYSKNSTIAFGRVRKNGTVFKSRDDKNIPREECGIYIDIFVIENTFNFKPMRYIHGTLSLLAGFNLSCRNFYANRKEYLSLVKNDKKSRRAFKTKIFIGWFFAWLKISTMVKIWDNINSMCHNEKSKYVTVPVGRNHFFGETYLRKNFCNMVEHDFEGKKFYICKDYDGYLKHMYGNYMQIPPKDKWETHVFYELDFGEER